MENLYCNLVSLTFVLLTLVGSTIEDSMLTNDNVNSKFVKIVPSVNKMLFAFFQDENIIEEFRVQVQWHVDSIFSIRLFKFTASFRFLKEQLKANKKCLLPFENLPMYSKKWMFQRKFIQYILEGNIVNCKGNCEVLGIFVFCTRRGF